MASYGYPTLLLFLSCSLHSRSPLHPANTLTFFISRLSSCGLWCYFSSLASLPTFAAHNEHSQPVFSKAALIQLHTPVFLKRELVVRRNMSRKKNSFFLHSPIHSLLQITPDLTNESLEGCIPQLLSSDPIIASMVSKSWVKPLP